MTAEEVAQHSGIASAAVGDVGNVHVGVAQHLLDLFEPRVDELRLDRRPGHFLEAKIGEPPRYVQMLHDIGDGRSRKDVLVYECEGALDDRAAMLRSRCAFALFYPQRSE